MSPRVTSASAGANFQGIREGELFTHAALAAGIMYRDTSRNEAIACGTGRAMWRRWTIAGPACSSPAMGE